MTSSVDVSQGGREPGRKGQTTARRRCARSALLVAVAVALASCSSSGGKGTAAPAAGDAAGGSSGSGTAAGGKLDELSVSVGGVGAYSSTLYLAQVKGFFTDNGVKVTIKPGGNNTLNLVVGGQVDLGVIGATQAMGPVANGKDTTLLYAPDTLASFIDAATSNPKITSLDQCKKVVTGGAGTSSYAVAALLKAQVKGNFQLIPGASQAIAYATVTSGQSDCVVGPYSYIAPGIANGKLRILVDGSKPQTIPAGIPASSPGMGVWGLTDHVAQHSDAVVKVLKGFDQAVAFMRANDPATIATALRTGNAADWGSIAQDALTEQIRVEKQYLGDGAIASATWPQWLQYAKFVYPQIQPDAPQWSYAKRVDMSYLNKARGK